MGVRGKAAGAGLAVAVAGVIACGPTIGWFRAQPNVICPRSATSLTWEASTGGVVTAQPPAAGVGDRVPAAGAVSVAPTQTTHFRLEVHNLVGHAAREVNVRVYDVPGTPLALGQSVADPSAGCDATGVWVTANAPPNLWDPHVRIGHVASRDGRAYHVEHGGRATEVAPAAPAEGLAGLAVAGPWLLKTPLGAGEACGRSVPRSLGVDVYPMCVQ